MCAIVPMRALRDRLRPVLLLTALEVTAPFLLITYAEQRVSAAPPWRSPAASPTRPGSFRSGESQHHDLVLPSAIMASSSRL
jgi:hypothetical protein